MRLEVEAAAATLREAQRRGARGRDRGHLRRDVGEDDLAAGRDALGRREPEPARPAGELEHAVAGARLAPARASARVTPRAARVDVVGVLAPSRRRPTAHMPCEVRAQRVRSSDCSTIIVSLLIAIPQVD